MPFFFRLHIANQNFLHMLVSTLPRGQRAPCQGLVIAGRCRGTFDRCVISGCRSCGIRVRNDATPLLRENLVIGCTGPGMVVWNRGKPEMEETPAWKRLGKYHFCKQNCGCL